jgi:hypothetical protein
MITFPHIGFIGRLGNQMFQYSALVGISKKHNLDYSLCKSDLEIYKCFNIPTKISSYYNPKFSSPNGFYVDDNFFATLNIDSEDQYRKLLLTKFDNNFFDDNHNDKSIVAFFQNYNYFKNVENELRSHFRFKKHYLDVCNYYFKETFLNQKVISLHIRRTDYLESTVLNHLDFDYYEKALNRFDKTLPVLVFSDDVEWCEQQDFFNSERFAIIRTNNTYIDLCLMSMCDYHIIANSSFSWWGSWLAKSKKTICPQQWFSEPYNELHSEGLTLPNWITL